MENKEQITLGLIVGNRGFFPEHLCKSGQKQIIDILEGEGFRVISLSLEDTTYGSVENLEDAQKCANLFSQHRNEIDGVVVTLPNFGDERAVANTLRWSGIDKPVLVHAFPDNSSNMTIADRRDSFCGKISVCNNLHQYGIKYSLTGKHVVDPSDESFKKDIHKFAGICRINRGMRNLRVGLIGARPASFNTVRFSEKILERTGISVEPIDLSEVISGAKKLTPDDQKVSDKIEEIRNYLPVNLSPDSAIVRMAKLGVVIDQWVINQKLSAVAIQCWTALEEIYGVVPCALMSIMSNGLLPSACETDVAGVIGMYALALASGKPSGIVDWNNNYGLEANKCVLFHCSNLPKAILNQERTSGEGQDTPAITYHEILADVLGKDKSWGAVSGQVTPGPFTYCRVSTDDLTGKIRSYLGEGRVTDETLATFGGYGVFEIPRMEELLQYICINGFEHHIAINPSETASVIHEAFTKYLEWDTYLHS